MFKTIGNGVPFLFSNGIAKTIRVFLEDSVCKR
jgi:site-specific DNA-cytosine methylase